MKKILITGGAGFIGSHTAVALTRAGYQPVIVDDLSNSKAFIIDRITEIAGKKPAFHKGDCKDRSFLTEVFKKEGAIDGVIHFAAYKAVGESTERPLEYYANNLGSLVALLDVMREHGTTKLVFSSSATVYGEPERNPITEEFPIKQATSPYGTTKIVCEQIIRDTVRSSSPLSAVALRYFNPIGAHPSGLIGELPLGTPNNLVPYLTQVASGKREKLTVHGNDYDTPDGTCVRDFIHVEDLARAHVDTLKYLEVVQAPFFDTFNVGTGRGFSVLELIQSFEKATGVALKYEFGPRRSGDVVACYAKAEKIKQHLGWEAKLTLEESLRDAWHWQQQLNKEGNLAL